jgi:hypothetical protein
MATKRGVSLPQDAYDIAAERAKLTGASVSQWLADAIKEKALTDSAKAAARALSRPDVAAELAAFYAWTAPARAAQAKRWADAA